MKKIVFLVLISCLVAACSSDRAIDMTYDCNPPGASIVEQGGGRLGSCPVTVQYHPNATQEQQGVFYTRKITAMWPDGTVSSVPSLTVDITQDRKASYTFVHAGDMQAVAPPAAPPPMPAPEAAPQPAPMEAAPPADAAGTVSMDYGAGQPPMPSPEASSAPEAPPLDVNAGGQAGQGPSGAHQDEDWFDSLNRKINCHIGNTIDATEYGCPPPSPSPPPQ